MLAVKPQIATACPSSAPALMQVHESGGKDFILSSSRCEVKLWDASKMDHGCAGAWEGCRGGCFSPDARFVAATAARQNSAYMFDAATRAHLLTMDEAEGETLVSCGHVLGDL